MDVKPWIEPIEFAQFAYDNYKEVCFLYSGIKHSYSGTKSFLAFEQIEEFNETKAIKEYLDKNTDQFLFGYFSYETNSPNLQRDSNYINFPFIKFSRYRNLVIFDHEKKEIISNCDIKTLDQANHYKRNDLIIIPKPKSHHSNMSDAEYLKKVAQIREDISAGDYCQANLTRKYWGEYQEAGINHFEIFQKLCSINPAPYSSFIKDGDKSIISSSPERFIAINENKINSRPIKGTNKKTNSNNQAKRHLYKSTKDRSENMMIVDLMRNDLTQYAKLGSVKVDRLFAIDAYPTLNHMSSSISALKRKEISNVDVITGSLPPGSMTGAPKIKVVERLHEMESLPRGIYSGSIGYFNGNKNCDFSVVIRTIFMEKNKFSYQVGGGIVFDSKPESELEETKIKDYSLRKALGII